MQSITGTAAHGRSRKDGLREGGSPEPLVFGNVAWHFWPSWQFFSGARVLST